MKVELGAGNKRKKNLKVWPPPNLQICLLTYLLSLSLPSLFHHPIFILQTFSSLTLLTSGLLPASQLAGIGPIGIYICLRRGF